MQAVETPGLDLEAMEQTLRTELQVPPDAVCAGVVGSTARGWATSQSDCDVYVVVRSHDPALPRKPVPLNPAWVTNVVRHVDDVRWEVTYWSEEQVAQMLGKVSWARFDAGTAPESVLTVSEEIFLSRLVEAVPIWGADWWTRSREQLSGSAFQAFQMSSSLNAYDSAKQTALGQLDAGDIECAVLSARRAFDFVTDALLEGCGSFGSRLTKWKPKRFAAVDQAVLPWEEFWEIASMRELASSGDREWVRRTLRRCQQVCLAIEIRRPDRA